MRKLLLVLGITAALVLASSAIALAATGNIIPHGGYASTTDVCLQCHDVHQAAGEYALTRWSTVTDTCGSCHTLYQTDPGALPDYAKKSPATPTGSYSAFPPSGGDTAWSILPGGRLGDPYTGAYYPGYNGFVATPGAAAPFMAYKTLWSNRYSHEGHRLGQLYAGQPILFADGISSGADYIPGGTESLTRIVSSLFYTTERASSVNTLLQGPNVDPWVTGLSGTAGLYCASCHTPHGQSGYMLPIVNGAGNPVGQDNILSSRPNHRLPTLTSTGVVELWNPADPIATIGDRNDVSSWANEGGNWCARCHDKRLFYTANFLGTSHYNHPDATCLACHASTTIAYDFPHTSQIPNLLVTTPDLLCITCHIPGTLP